MWLKVYSCYLNFSSTSPFGFHVQRTFDDFLIVEREFMWRSSTYLLKKLVERSTQDYCYFFFFLLLCTTSLTERVDVFFDLLEVASRLVCSRAASYPCLTAPGQTFPRDVETAVWIVSTIITVLKVLVGFFRRSFTNSRHVALSHETISTNRLFPSHDLPDICCRNNGSVLRYFISPVIWYFRSRNFLRLDKRVVIVLTWHSQGVQ